MYEKNLTEDLRLRLSTRDMDFLRDLSAQRSVSISECIRSILSEYRRSLEVQDLLRNALIYANNENKKIDLTEGKLSHGDTETSINDKL